MFGFLLAQKGKQSQIFDEKGNRVPTTFLKTNPCYLLDVTLPVKNGVGAVKLAMGNIKNIKKPQLGELKKAGIETPLRFFREVKVPMEGVIAAEGDKKGVTAGETTILVGDALQADQIFKKGDIVDIAGTSKGKGFQGVMKRHGFKGGPKTHGQSDRARSPGSMGQGTTPGHTYKGKRMAGRMGGERITVQNLEILEVQADGVLVRGLVPGTANSLVEIVYHK